MSSLRRALLGVLAFLPAAGVLGLAITTVLLTHGRPEHVIARGPLELRLPALTLDEAIPVGIAVLVVAFVQIGVAIPLILHAQKNARLAPGLRLVWVLFVLFVGSIGAPVYWGKHVRTDRG